MNELTATATAALDPVYEWGLAVIRAAQSTCPAILAPIARFFSLLGDPVAYLIILPVVFWCIDERRGFRAAFAVFLSNGINIALKDFLRVPRPFTQDPSVKLADAAGFSTPSGHSQNSAAFWPVLLLGETRRPFALAAAILLPLCIGLSRVYLGVHYPTDIGLGWLLGALISVGALAAVPAITRAISRSLAREDSALSLFRASLYASRPATGRGSAANPVRTAKIAATTVLSAILLVISGEDSSMAGLLFGFTAGYIHLDGSFRASEGTIKQKAARLALGLLGLATLYFVTKMAFPGESTENYRMFRFIRYALVGAWTSWGAPKLFASLKLS